MGARAHDAVASTHRNASGVQRMTTRYARLARAREGTAWADQARAPRQHRAGATGGEGWGTHTPDVESRTKPRETASGTVRTSMRPV